MGVRTPVSLIEGVGIEGGEVLSGDTGRQGGECEGDCEEEKIFVQIHNTCQRKEVMG